MQELALQAVAAARAVFGVAGDRVSDRGEVDSDLVRAPGLQARLRRACRPAVLDAPRSGFAPRADPAADGPPGAVPAVAPEGRVDGPGRGCRGGPRPAPVYSRPTSRPSSARERAVRLLVAGDDHQPRGVLVEPVDDPGRSPSPPPAIPSSRSTRVSPLWRGRGCTTSPAGFSITARPSSRWTISVAPRASRASLRLRAPTRARAARTPAEIARSATLKVGHSGRLDEVGDRPVPDPVGEVPERAADQQGGR